jgi:ActR/RegA family two-component response regulator
MFELTINESIYQFKFGMGFMREINKTVTKPIDGINKQQEMGLQYAVAGLIDEDPAALVDVLLIANKTEKNRVTKNALDAYIENEETDVSAVCAEVLDFLSKANATKKVTVAVMEAVENEKQKQAQK